MKKRLKVIYVVLFILLIILITLLRGLGKKEANTYEKIKAEVMETTETTLEKETMLETEETKIKSESKETPTESSEKPTEDVSGVFNYTAALSIDYNQLKQMNSDYVCWINIPDTKVSYPVVLPEDNDFYLHRTFDTKEYAYAGTLFIDAFSTRGLNQDNLIIYGHNMKNGGMFGELQKFKKESYFEDHPYIEIYGKDETRVYLIFSVRDVTSDIETLNFALENFDRKEYIKKAIAESIQYRDIESENQIITLSTCVGDYSRRLLISGIRIK